MAVWKKKNGCWYGRVVHNKVTHNLPKCYPSRAEAEYAVHMLKATLKSKRAVDKLAMYEQMISQEEDSVSTIDHYANIKIQDGWAEYAKLGHTNIAQLSVRSVEMYSGYYKSFAEYAFKYRKCWCLRDVNTQVISDYVAYLNSKGNTKNRINSIIIQLRKVWRGYSIVSTHRCFKNNPFDIIDTKAVPRVEYRRNFEDDEIDKIYEVLDNPKNAYDRRKFPHLKLFVTLCLRTGLRKIDVCNLEWEDIVLDEDIEKRLLILKPQKTKWLNKEVVIPIADDLYELLKARKAECDNDSVYVDDQLRAWYNSRWIEGLHRNLLKRANLNMDEIIDGKKHTVLCAHSWRHTFISKCANSENPIAEQVVMDLVAHCSINIHRKYQHVDVKAKARAIKSITEGNKKRVTLLQEEYDKLIHINNMWNQLPPNVRDLLIELDAMGDEKFKTVSRLQHYIEKKLEEPEAQSQE